MSILEQQNHSLVQIKEAKNLVKNSKKIVVGAGAGLSAAAGIDYHSESFFKEHYPEFSKENVRVLQDAVKTHWEITDQNKWEYWRFWRTHIKTVYYNQTQRNLYKELYELIKDKDYFIITTNVDAQFLKGLFDPKRVYIMQGSYGYLQCKDKCHNTLYPAEEYVESIKEEIPRCSQCGAYLIPNLRIDQNFVDTSFNAKISYMDFIDGDEDLLLLELGVGYHTPIIIRYPFEDMTHYSDTCKLIRVNKEYPSVHSKIKDKSLTYQMDIKDFVYLVKR